MTANSSLHLWQAQISTLARHCPALEAVLSADERGRAARFFNETVRTRFIVARGVLRYILSKHTRIPPQELAFVYGARGKPTLPDVQFNLSHTNDLILIGVSPQQSLGVDVEYIYPIPEMATIARDYFSINEQHALFALPPEQRQDAFFTLWTRKEAYIKATGDGFSMPLHNFDVTLNHPPRMTRAEGDDPTRWHFYHLEPLPGYIGALCVLGHDFELIHTTFDDSSLNS